MAKKTVKTSKPAIDTPKASKFKPAASRNLLIVVGLFVLLLGAALFRYVSESSTPSASSSQGSQTSDLNIPSTASLYISPPSANYSQNQTFSVEVRAVSENKPVNAVQANLSYSSDKLEVVSIDGSTGAFKAQAQNEALNGKIYIARGSITPQKGDLLVAKIIFKGKSAGTAKLDFAAGTQLVSSTTNQNLLSASNSKIGSSYLIQ